MNESGEQGEELVRTVCHSACGMVCGLLAHVKDGVLTKVEPAPMPEPRHQHICARGLSTIQMVYHPDRLKYPLKRAGERGEGKWERISWDEALDTIATRLTEIGDKYGYRSLMWCVATIGGLDLMYASLAGTLNGTFVSIIGDGDSAGPCGDMASFGAIWGDKYLTGMENPSLCILWGTNPAETSPFAMRQLRDYRERGARMVVIDPRFTPTAAKADQYIRIRPGTDVALALGMINVILENGLQDERFITEHTVGPFLVDGRTGLFVREKDLVADGSEQRYMVWDKAAGGPRPSDVPGETPPIFGVYDVNGIECRPAFQLLADLIKEYTPEKTSEITDVPADIIRELALDHVRCKPVANYRGMGVQRTFHGDLMFRAVATLGAITGNIHPEAPQLPVYELYMYLHGIMTCNIMPILKAYDAIDKGDPYPVKALWIAKQNWVNQLPEANRVTREIFPKLDFIVVADIFMTASARYADIVLPSCTFYEQMDLVPPINVTPAMPDYFQLQHRVIDPLHECKTDSQIVRELARRMKLGEYFENSDEQLIEMLLAQGYPAEMGITTEKLKKGAVKAPLRPGFPAFLTPSGKMEFYCERIVESGQQLPCYIEPMESARKPLAEKYPLTFFTTHTRYRTHSTLANAGWLRELEPEPLLEMNTLDAENRQVRDGDLVQVFNDRGTVKLKARVHEGIQQGTVNVAQGWWPEDFAEGSHQELTHSAVNRVQEMIYEPNSALYDVLVEVRKVQEG
ncbi:MAG: molybdopterin-dependent oxidoreductase [Dehalococcoidia bacterium]